jgi:magnesium-transporting ATPase (P-type)
MAGLAHHALPVERVVEELKTDAHKGLSSQEARVRLERYGPNELQEKPRPGFLKLLWDQLNNFLILILIAAAVLSLLLGEWIDAIAILAIVVLNSVLGVVQESRAEQALAALKKMAAPSARVIRDGQQMTIPARSERTSLFKIGVFSNKWMLYAVILSVGMLFAVIYVPFLQTVFGTVPLTLNDWVVIVPFMLLASIAAELTKVYLRARAGEVKIARELQYEIG